MEAAHEKVTSGCEEGYLPDGGWRRFVRAGRISLRTCTRSRSIRSLGHSALPCPHSNIRDSIAARRLVPSGSRGMVRTRSGCRDPHPRRRWTRAPALRCSGRKAGLPQTTTPRHPHCRVSPYSLAPTPKDTYGEYVYVFRRPPLRPRLRRALRRLCQNRRRLAYPSPCSPECSHACGAESLTLWSRDI